MANFLSFSFVLPKVGILNVPNSQAGRAQPWPGAPQVADQHVGEAAARAELRRVGLGAHPDQLATALAEPRRSGLGACRDVCGDSGVGGSAAPSATTWPGPCRPRCPFLCQCQCSASLGAPMALAEALSLMGAGPSRGQKFQKSEEKVVCKTPQNCRNSGPELLSESATSAAS